MSSWTKFRDNVLKPVGIVASAFIPVAGPVVAGTLLSKYAGEKNAAAMKKAEASAIAENDRILKEQKALQKKAITAQQKITAAGKNSGPLPGLPAQEIPASVAGFPTWIIFAGGVVAVVYFMVRK